MLHGLSNSLNRMFRRRRENSDMSLRFPEVARPDYPNPMPPPWIAFPDIAPDSIGWRMGSGEVYMMDFHQWYMQLNDVAARHLRERWPAPEDWADFYPTYETRRRTRHETRRRR